MCDFLCLQLRDSLNAAFMGAVYDGEKSIGGWGRAVVEALHSWNDKWLLPHCLVWHVAHSNLQKMIMECPCEGLVQSILRNPEGFLKTTLILASLHQAGRRPPQSVVLH